jgi:hypothetical protein
MNKKRIANHINYSWPFYLAWVGCALAIWLTAYQQYLAYHDNEQIRFVVCTDSYQYETMEKNLKSTLPSLTSQKIEAVSGEVLTYSELSDSILSIRCIDGTDFLIMPDSYIRTGEGSTYFMAFTDKMKTMFAGSEFFTQDEKTYAVKLTSDSRACSYLSTSDTKSYSLFFFPSSVNLGQENSKGNAGDDAALKAAVYLAGKEGS